MISPATLERTESIDEVKSVVRIGAFIINVTSRFCAETSLSDLMLEAAKENFCRNIAGGSDNFPQIMYNQQ